MWAVVEDVDRLRKSSPRPWVVTDVDPGRAVTVRLRLVTATVTVDAVDGERCRLRIDVVRCPWPLRRRARAEAARVVRDVKAVVERSRIV